MRHNQVAGRFLNISPESTTCIHMHLSAQPRRATLVTLNNYAACHSRGDVVLECGGALCSERRCVTVTRLCNHTYIRTYIPDTPIHHTPSLCRTVTVPNFLWCTPNQTLTGVSVVQAVQLLVPADAPAEPPFEAAPPPTEANTSTPAGVAPGSITRVTNVTHLVEAVASGARDISIEAHLDLSDVPIDDLGFSLALLSSTRSIRVCSPPPPTSTCMPAPR